MTRPLEQLLKEEEILVRANLHSYEIIRVVQRWLEETHKEWKQKIQYEEMFVEEVIPRLVGNLKNVK